MRFTGRTDGDTVWCLEAGYTRMTFGIMDIEVPCEILDNKSRVLGSRDTRDGIPSSVVEEYLLGELAQVHPITRALSGTPPSTGRAVRDSSTRSSSYTRGSNEIRGGGELSVLKFEHEVHNYQN